MSFFKETSTSKDSEQAEKIRETDRPKLKDSDNSYRAPIEMKPRSDLSNVLNSAFKAFGFTEETNSENKLESSETAEDKDYSKCLEEGDDGRYYDRETGRVYDSVEDWVKAQETLAKKYDGAADYFHNKANKEWARFKNADANGESEEEKWKHYRKAQEYYTKAKECKEKAAHIRERLEQNEQTDQSDTGKADETDEADKTNETDETNNMTDASDSPGKPIQNKIDGLQREAEVKKELEEKYPPEEGYKIISEAYLRDADGNIVKDPETGKARRVDFVVVKGGKVVDSIEVTSQTADKKDQLAKESRIRECGGNYVCDNNGNLIEIPSSVHTRVERRD